jgi:hypothetical protein
VKTFIDNRRKYERKFINREALAEDDETSDATIFGNLVDCLLFTPDDFNARFKAMDFRKPTGQMLDFVEELWRVTQRYTTEEGRLTREFLSICDEAFHNVAFDRNGERVAFKQKGMTVEKVLQRFEEEGRSYYQHLRTAGGRMVVDPSEMERAEEFVRILRTNFATRALINIQGDSIQVLDQQPVFFEYRGLPMKSLIDRMVVDHDKKLVRRIDLKTCWNTENFGYNYRKLRYYIQNALYGVAVITWLEQQNLQDYELQNMEFLVGDPYNQFNPLVVETTDEQLVDALNGFTHDGTVYMGLKEAVDRIRWHREKGIWNISRENYEARGRITLKY